jgi:hypothetical protein
MSRVHIALTGFELTPFVVKGIDCIGSCKSIQCIEGLWYIISFLLLKEPANTITISPPEINHCLDYWSNIGFYYFAVIPSRFLRVVHTDKYVAFSAGLTHLSTLHVSNNDTVPYDRVFLNLGKGYNATSGVFTSPRTGTYVFMYHALAQQNKQLQLDLYRNDATIRKQTQIT